LSVLSLTGAMTRFAGDTGFAPLFQGDIVTGGVAASTAVAVVAGVAVGHPPLRGGDVPLDGQDVPYAIVDVNVALFPLGMSADHPIDIVQGVGDTIHYHGELTHDGGFGFRPYLPRMQGFLQAVVLVAVTNGTGGRTHVRLVVNLTAQGFDAGLEDGLGIVVVVNAKATLFVHHLVAGECRLAGVGCAISRSTAIEVATSGICAQLFELCQFVFDGGLTIVDQLLQTVSVGAGVAAGAGIGLALFDVAGHGHGEAVTGDVTGHGRFGGLGHVTTGAGGTVICLEVRRWDVSKAREAGAFEHLFHGMMDVGARGEFLARRQRGVVALGAQLVGRFHQLAAIDCLRG